MDNFVNPHMEEWAKYTDLMKEAMLSNDIDTAQEMKDKADSEYAQYKEFADKMYSCNGFESCNQAIQESLDYLIKYNTKAVKEIMSLIKEDKNLSAQFSFYKSLNECSANYTIIYLNEALDIISNKIDYKTIKESNEKLVNLVRKYGIVPKNDYSDDKKKLFENCEYIITNKKKMSNLNEYSTRLKEVNDYICNNIKPINESKKTVYTLIEDYDKKYNSLLNEEEKSFVQEIMDWKNQGNSSKKQSFFESLKKECINGVNKLLETCSEEEKGDLTSIKEEINNKQFCEETLVKDVAKLLELRDVLLEK